MLYDATYHTSRLPAHDDMSYDISAHLSLSAEQTVKQRGRRRGFPGSALTVGAATAAVTAGYLLRK